MAFYLTCGRCGAAWQYEKPNPRGGALPKVCPACKPIAARERSRAYEHRHSVRVADAKRRWRLDNPDKMQAARKAWEAKHPERRREWRSARKKQFPEVNRSYVRARKARQRQATVVPFTPTQLYARLAVFGNRCWLCGAPGTTIDHVKPLAKGGAHMLANLRPACNECNAKKGSKWPVPTSLWSSRGAAAVSTEKPLLAGVPNSGDGRLS